MSRKRISGSTFDEPTSVFLLEYLLFPIPVVGLLVAIANFDGEYITDSYRLMGILAFVLSMQIFGRADIYRASNFMAVIGAFAGIAMRWIGVVAALAVCLYITEFYFFISPRVLLTWVVATPFVLVISQFLVCKLVSYAVNLQPTKTAVIVGANQLGCELNSNIRQDRFLGVHVSALFDDRSVERLPASVETDKLNKFSELLDYVKNNNVHIIYVCLPIAPQSRISKLLDELGDTTASIYFVPDIFTVDLIQSRIDRISGIPIIALCETPFYGLRRLVKRIADIAVAGAALLMIWPLLLVIGLGVKLTSPGPIFFKQRRYGINGQEILVYKFRSMKVCEDGDKVVQARRDDDRITPFGRFLRKTSLDELPQFLNVLEGTMSVVGPRPHAVAHNEMYRKDIKGYMIRHKVKPGITGLAQVNGLRGETTTVDQMRARVQCDIDYMRNWSLSLDLWIIFKTIGVLFGDRHAY